MQAGIRDSCCTAEALLLLVPKNSVSYPLSNLKLSSAQLKLPNESSIHLSKDGGLRVLCAFNKAVAKIRAPGERPFAVMQRVFHGGRTHVKNLARVTVEQAMECFAFNLYQLFTLARQRRL